MSIALYLIAGPVTGADGSDLRARANGSATAWDPTGGQYSFLPPMLYVLAGGNSTVATHTAIHLRVDDDVAPTIQAAIAADFQGWQMIQADDVDFALTLAGLGRVAFSAFAGIAV